MQAAAKVLNEIRVRACGMRTDYSSGSARSLLEDAGFDAFKPDAVALYLATDYTDSSYKSV